MTGQFAINNGHRYEVTLPSTKLSVPVLYYLFGLPWVMLWFVASWKAWPDRVTDVCLPNLRFKWLCLFFLPCFDAFNICGSGANRARSGSNGDGMRWLGGRGREKGVSRLLFGVAMITLTSTQCSVIPLI